MTDKSKKQELIAGLPEVRTYPMMGEYVLYCKEKVIGGIFNNRIMLKNIPETQRYLEGAPAFPPYAGAEPMFVVENEDKAFLTELFFAAAEGLPAPKPKKKK